MAQRGILEYDAKTLLSQAWGEYFGDTIFYSCESALVEDGAALVASAETESWLKKKALVVKPDMLFGERGKNGLVLFKKKKPGDITLKDASKWINQKIKKPVTLKDGTTGDLRRFIVEPFIPHNDEEECFACIRTDVSADIVSMSACGGMDISANWNKVTEVRIPLDHDLEEAKKIILSHVPKDVQNRAQFGAFIVGLYAFFRERHFTYLEINPVVIQEDTVHLLDCVAKVDDTAGFLMTEQWGNLEYPAGFGREQRFPEENIIQELDEKSGASLKLTILNPKGRVWTLVAGGGASVVFADTISEMWGVEHLANYGEYSGNPSTQETHAYTATILDLMTRKKDPKGKEKILLIGGAIANFTDVNATFKGIIQALTEYAEKMRKIGVRIYVRRGGPNYEMGLKNMYTAAKRLRLSIEVYGPETHMTDIVAIALDDTKGGK